MTTSSELSTPKPIVKVDRRPLMMAVPVKPLAVSKIWSASQERPAPDGPAPDASRIEAGPAGPDDVRTLIA